MLSLKENMDLVMKNIISEKDLTAQAVGFVKEGPHCTSSGICEGRTSLFKRECHGFCEEDRS